MTEYINTIAFAEVSNIKYTAFGLKGIEHLPSELPKMKYTIDENGNHIYECGIKIIEQKL